MYQITTIRYDQLDFYAEFREKGHHTVHITLVDPMASVSNFLLKTDVFILLDCCYNGSAIRDSKNNDRIVELISAV